MVFSMASAGAPIACQCLKLMHILFYFYYNSLISEQDCVRARDRVRVCERERSIDLYVCVSGCSYVLQP